jgi:hypothetical protein
MDAPVIITIVAAAVVVIAVVAFLATRPGRQRRRLHERFGPEYDRTVGKANSRKDRKAAERELTARAERRDRLSIHPLGDDATGRYREQWAAVQGRFVEAPHDALAQADLLVALILREQGYPASSFDDQADVVSVDHPQAVENYRFAHRTLVRPDRMQATTEELRQGLVHYRVLIDDLLEAPDHRRGRTDNGPAGQHDIDLRAAESATPVRGPAASTAYSSTARAGAQDPDTERTERTERTAATEPATATAAEADRSGATAADERQRTASS